MKLSEYFEGAKGFGVLATTDANGKVNTAIYSKPLFLDEDGDATCYFIMSHRVTHDNLSINPSASYLFIEEGGRFSGKRLSLMVGLEDFDPEKAKAIRCQNSLPIRDEDCKYLVQFHIEDVRPLLGKE